MEAEHGVSFQHPNGTTEFILEGEEAETFIATEIQEYCNVGGSDKNVRHKRHGHERRHLLLHTLCVCGSAFSLVRSYPLLRCSKDILVIVIVFSFLLLITTLEGKVASAPPS